MPTSEDRGKLVKEMALQLNNKKSKKRLEYIETLFWLIFEVADEIRKRNTQRMDYIS